MKIWITHVLAGTFILSASSLLGCSSDTSPATAGSGGALAASGGASSLGGASTGPVGSGGAATGGMRATGGQTVSQGGTSAQGGAETGGATKSTGGTPSSGGSAAGGSAAGGSGTGGSATGGQANGGAASGGSETGGSKTDGGPIGGTTVGDAAAGGKTSTGGAATGGTATGGKTGTGGTAAGGTTGDGGTTPMGGGLGSSDGTTPIKVWMSGDSTMAGDACVGGGWADQFGSLFNSNVTIENHSVAGRSIQTWLYEKNVSSTAGADGECTLTATTYSANWNAMLDANTGMKKGDYLFIEFGINDGDATCPRHVGTTLFETYLTTMAKAASDRGAEAIFLTSTSAIACNGATAQANRGFGPQTKAAGAADGVPVIDMTVLTAALYTSAGLCPNNSDYTSTTSKVGLFFCNDHTHFEPAGALQVAQTAATALKNQGIGLAAYLKN
jgi:lysophospholipase L1-like esterase